jgi:ABC-2 type transport system ATP-binding protein
MGRAWLAEVDSRAMRPQDLAKAGYVAADMRLPAALRVEEWMEYLRPFYPRWDQAEARALLEALELPGGKRLGQLSLG